MIPKGFRCFAYKDVPQKEGPPDVEIVYCRYYCPREQGSASSFCSLYGDFVEDSSKCEECLNDREEK